MKTIAITIDENTLKSLEELAENSVKGTRSRSRIIRKAIREFVAKESKRRREARGILKKHRARLAREARALVSEQVKV